MFIFTFQNANKKKNYATIRQKRPCPYCQKLIFHFAAHLTSVHKDLDEVKLIGLIKNAVLRKKKYRNLLKTGIRKHNESVAAPSFMRMKSVKTESTHFRCSLCDMIFISSSSSRHKQTCQHSTKNPGRMRGVVEVGNGNFSHIDLGFLEKDFNSEIYLKMRNDNVKRILENDVELMFIGIFNIKSIS